MALIAASVTALGQPAARAPNDRISLPSQIELPRLVDLAAQRLGLAIEYDAAVLKGSATLRLPGDLSNDDLWVLTNSVLATRGFAVVRPAGAGGLSVVRMSEAPSMAGVARVGPDGEIDAGGAGYASVMLRTSVLPGKQAADALRSVLSRSGSSVVQLPDSAAPGEEGAAAALLLVSDLVPRLREASALLRRIDAAADTTVSQLAVRNLGPAQLAAAVAQVAAKREQVSGERVPGEVLPAPGGGAVLLIAPARHRPYWIDLINTLDQREPVATHTYAPRRFAAREVASLLEQSVREAPGAGPSDERWRIVIDELSGVLMVTATPTQHEAINAIIARLDDAPAGAARPTRAFPIRNRPVSQLLQTLSRLVDAGVLEDEGEGQAGRAPPPGAQVTLADPQPSPPAPRHDRRPAGAAGRDLALTADEPTNTLIAVGVPRTLAQIEGLVRMLDRRQPQVMLRVMLVSLSESQSRQLGIELEKLISAGGARIRLASLFGLSSAAGAPGAEARNPGEAAGLNASALSPGDFSVVVRALEALNDGQSLSMPTVLVNNNEQAQFSSVLQQPFVNTNISNTVATTSFGGTQDAGTTISVRPQIAEGDHLVLQYSLALSSFVGAPALAGLPPPRQQNRVDSIATVPDGFTVVVGGLEVSAEGRSQSRVPFLGAIPLLGELFKSRAGNQSRSRFFVFIQPTVLRHETFEDLKYLSGRDIENARSSGVSIDSGWPELSPRVIR